VDPIDIEQIISESDALAHLSWRTGYTTHKEFAEAKKQAAIAAEKKYQERHLKIQNADKALGVENLGVCGTSRNSMEKTCQKRVFYPANSPGSQ
jgi:hypothetical protein